MSLFVSVVLLVVVLGGVVDAVSGGERKISTAEDFTLFSNEVNNGTNHSGTTVFLCSDIDLSNVEFEPIGVNFSINFRGVFDGQGYVIRNLAINSTLRNVGLFGYAYGATIRNVVVDESCSVESSYTPSSSSGNSGLGGLIGYYQECHVENSVNMASVTFRGNVNTLYLGGIIGYASSSSVKFYVKNCANYGSVAFSGSGSSLYFGGIVGCSPSASSNKLCIQNCANYGTLSSNDDASTAQNIGGMVGRGSLFLIENCLSAGRISSNSSHIGSIISSPLSSTSITHSFWTSDVGCDNVSGSGTPSIDNETSKAELGAALWNKLNNYSVTGTNSSWLLLHMNGGQVNSNITKELLVSPSKHLPAPKKEWHTFAGWFVDSNFSKEYEPDGESRSTPTDIYAKFAPNNYTVSFNVSGGDELSVPTSTEVGFNTTYGVLPTPTRAGYTFLGWFTDANESVTNETIVKTPSNHTLYAHWEETPANHVEITFNTKDLSKKDIEEIVRQYTNAEFTIVEYEKGDGSEGTRVIIRFTDAKDAVTFVDFVRELSDETKKLIQRIDLISDYAGSFSSMFSPILFFYLM